jgi:hypothetical protein
MSEEELTIEEQVKFLEDFIYNNEELESLEAIVDKFNIFSSLGIINQEIRHSNFLAWILDPNETHNLSDYFTVSFLKQVTFNNSNPDSKISLFDIDTLDLTDTQVLREWNNIDVLLVNEDHKLLCVIENKVDSKEHSNQLKRYKDIVESNYPDYRKLFVYLTVNGEVAEGEATYVSVSYREVSELINRLLERKATQLSDEVTVFIRHYNDMIKRYIMEESEIQELCEQLYKKHKKALDLIFKHKPDLYSDIRDVLEEIIDENHLLEKDHCSKSYIRFISKSLDFLPKEGEGWTKTNRILLFEIQNYDKAVDMFLIIGPGPTEIREKIYNHVKENPLFNKTWSQLPKKWASIYKIKLSSVSRLDGKNKEDLKLILKENLDKFLEMDYPNIEMELLQLS